MKRCLYCYTPLAPQEEDFHASCSRKIFGQPTPPALPYTEQQMEELATQVIRRQMTVTGVQPKLSLDIVSGEAGHEARRFTIVGLWGGYILKPPTPHYPQLPEVEDLTMHLAEIAKISTVPHSLIRLQSGSLAYITKRIDRVKKKKWAMEDMCQLTERLTEDKYHGSYEQIAKAILKYSVNPGLDVVNFFEQVLFSFLTGNADMHLKNFSLITRPEEGPVLSPAYDMVATVLVNPADDEDMALTLNGKKKKLKRGDFTAAFTTLKLDPKQQENIFKKMEKAKEPWLQYISMSFLSPDLQEAYKQLIHQRFSRLTRQ
ncbi:HipA domain-containing protein [Runella slithyformis]|uniref:HipA domain protein n=1 Tax=Runella slithyformis (strain ATCC 29530 / DSM 19594 / LMG 11500 / NCIMB 11436 / LSU 4) TaxID=761193 RepID=A0A7U4E7R9_RUNSL|nr:HipA domain-containing protein [Runella slithyformis]AEI50608.1 HipA domain protein [Runella slithyformis DSM 19594]